MSTTKTELLKTIRQKCLDCVCFQSKEVELCPSEHCALWPFRFAKDPFKTPRVPSAAQKESLAKAQAARKQKTERPRALKNSRLIQACDYPYESPGFQK